jgi:hypothetical protein
MYSVLGTEAMDVLLSFNFVTIYFLFRCAAGWRQKKKKKKRTSITTVRELSEHFRCRFAIACVGIKKYSTEYIFRRFFSVLAITVATETKSVKNARQ